MAVTSVANIMSQNIQHPYHTLYLLCVYECHRAVITLLGLRQLFLTFRVQSPHATPYGACESEAQLSRLHRTCEGSLTTQAPRPKSLEKIPKATFEGTYMCL